VTGTSTPGSPRRWRRWRRWRRCALAAAVGCALLVVPAPDAARAAADDDRGPAFALSITPVSLKLSPAQLRRPHYVTVSNTGGRPALVEVSTRDFVTSLDGSVRLTQHTSYSAKSWVRAAPNRFRLPAGGTRRVRVTVAMPSDAEPGDHQTVLVFVGRGAAGGPGIQVRRGVGAPVLLTLPGTVDSTVRLLSLGAPGLVLGGPVRFTATMQNTGTVHRDFHAAQRLAVEVDGGRVTFPDFSVLRGATRTVTVTWHDPPLLCLCRATVAMRLPDGALSRASVRVTVIPLHLIAVAVAVGMGVALLVRWRRRRYREDVLAAARALGEGSEPRP
jgi:hypothetical protein